MTIAFTRRQTAAAIFPRDQVKVFRRDADQALQAATSLRCKGHSRGIRSVFIASPCVLRDETWQKT